MRKLSTIFSSFVLLIVLSAMAWGQTPVPMSSQGGLTYTENFSDIANWTNAFASGVGASRWKSVAVNATGTLGDGIKTTVATATFSTGSSGGVQKGTNNIYQLSTSTANSNAIEFFMDFTGVNAGTVSFDVATVFNSTGDRDSKLKLFYSTDGTTYTEITGTNLPYTARNNVAGSASISVALPSAFNGSSTARLRFYEYSTTAGGTPTGSQPKISIDNLVVTATAAASASSDIIANGSFTYPTNINYAGNTGSDVTSSNPELFEFNIRDGGGSADGDALSTTLSAITFSVANSSVLNKVALYDGSTELAEVAAGSTITFTGLTAAAADDGLKTLNLRATYNTTVTDNTQFSFTVTSATADGAGSTFATGNAGGAASSTTGDNNKIEVTASTLTFSTPSPATPAVGANISVTVSAKDANGNKDLDYGSNVTLSTQSGTGSFSAASTTTHTAAAGDANWTDLQYDVAETGVAIHATDGSLTGNSSTFTVVSSYSSVSDVTAVVSSESATISSLENTAGALTSSQGAQVWQVTVRDGGGTTDDDNLPTIVTALTLSQGGSNTVSSWSSAILAADLFDGSTHLASGTVGASSIAFSGFTATAADNGSKTLSVRISLKNTGLTDNQIFHFSLTNANTTTQSSVTSSQMSAFSTINSSGTDNKIAVVATKYVFSSQPSGTTTVNTNFGATVQAQDANNNLDLDDASNVTISASTGTVTSAAGNPHALSSGAYAWTDLQNNTPGTGITLSASGTLTSATSSSMTVYAAQPTAATTPLFTNVTSTSLTLSWTNGGGANRIVVARATATSIVAPSLGSGYTVNSPSFIDGVNSTTGTGNIVVFNGSGSTVNISDLTAGTSYTFDVYEYNGSTGTYNYSSALSSAKSTMSAEPTVQATAVTFTNVSATGFKINWTLGNGANSIVVVKDVTAVDSDPVDGTTYTSSATFGSGTQIGTGNYVVYKATLNNVTISGLTDGHTYNVAVYSFNGSSGTENYLTTTPATGSQIAASPTYYSQASGDPNTLSNWNSARGGGGSAPADFITTGTYIIQNSHTMTTTATWSFGASGSILEIESGGTLSAPFAVTIASGATFKIDNGGTYVHSNTSAFGSTIFAGTESFAANSTVEFRDWNSTGPSVTAWGNVKFNATGAVAGAIQFSGTLTTINGNLEIIATGSTVRDIRLSTTQTFTLAVAGDVTISGGSIDIASGAGSSAVRTINIGGSFNQSGGTVKCTGTSNAASINFTGTGKTFTQSGGTLTNTNLNWGVNSGASLSLGSTFAVATSRTLSVSGTLDCSTNNVTGSGAVTIASGATLKIGFVDGITASGATGVIQTTTRTFNSGANYEYISGSAAQVTGDGLPATVNNLKINNSFGVTLSGNTTVNGILTLTNGNIITGANNLTIASGGSVSRTSGHIVGNLQKAIAIGASTNNFEVGTGSDYTPLALNFASVGTGGNLTVTTAASEHANLNASHIDGAKSVNRTWSITNSGVASVSYDATMNFVSGDVDGGANTSNFIVGHYSGSSWDYPTVGTKTSTSTQATGLTSFSDFALGEVQTYTVTFDANTGTGSMSNQSAAYGATTALTSNAFTKSNYHFTGWNTQAGGGGTGYADGANYDFTANVTLYAQWEMDSYTVTFDANGGTGSMSNQSSSVAANLTSNAFTRTGYTFAGWNTVAGGGGTSYADGVSYPFTSSVTLYAQWTINSYSITASAGANGAISPDGATSVNYDGSQSYTITPDAGYRVSDVLVDGSSIGAVTSHEFTNVTATHTISVSFSNNFAAVATGNWSDGSTWGGAVPASASVVAIGGYTVTLTGNASAASVTVQSAGLLEMGTYTLTGSGALTVQNGGTLKLGSLNATDAVANNVQMTGGLTLNSGSTVEMNGTASQKLAARTFAGLKINNSTGVTLGGSVTVNGTLTLTDGSLTTSTNTVTLGSAGTITGEAVGRYVIGNLTTTRTVGIGASESFGGMGVAFGSGNTNLGSVVMTRISGPGSYRDQQSRSSINRRWKFTVQNLYASNAGHQRSITLTWVSNDDNLRNMEMARIFRSNSDFVNGYFAASSTTDIFSSNPRSITGTMDWLEKTPTVNSFTIFSEADAATPLPVELTSFAGTATNRKIQLTWSTATEHNNSGFEIERKPIDESNQSESMWSKIGFVQGAGTSNAPLNYQYNDAVTSIGTFQYRLRQTDQNGKSVYSDAIEVVTTLAAEDYTLSANYPNPFNPSTVFTFAVKKEQMATVKVYNTVGQEVATLFNGIAEADQLYTLRFDARNLSSGTYFYILHSDKRHEVKKMMLLK